MEIIDEKGRLFGKLNIVDFIISILLICFIALFLIGYKTLSKIPEIKREFITVDVNCLFIKVMPSIAHMVSLGDKETDKDGQIIGEVLQVGEVKPFFFELDLSPQGGSITKESELKQISAKLRLKAEIKGKSIYYKNSLISVNSVLVFKTSKYTLEMIPEIKEDMQEKLIDIDVVLKDLDKDRIKLISKGDKDMGDDGKVTAEILEVKHIGDSSVDIDLGSGYYTTADTSNKDQVTVKMRMRCQINKNNQIYFKGVRLRYNSAFQFETEKYKVDAQIVKAYELISPLREKWINLQVKFSSIIPEVDAVIHKDDVAKDSSQRVIAKVNSIISNQQSKMLTFKDGQLVSVPHPFNYDLEISLTLLCAERDGVYYFNSFPIKIGNPLVFSTDLYSITGTIVGLEMN